MARLEAPTMADKELCLKEWVRRKLGALDHELRVASLARALFDATHPWHALPLPARRLLSLGALAHDVGRSIDDDGHARHGATLLLNNTSLPLAPDERRRIAFLTRYHRGSVPAPGDEEILHPDRDRDLLPALRTLLGLLRAADALDKRSLTPPRFSIRTRGRTLHLRGLVDDRSAVDGILGKPKKLRLLQETLSCDLRLDWIERAPATLVA